MATGSYALRLQLRRRPFTWLAGSSAIGRPALLALLVRGALACALIVWCLAEPLQAAEEELRERLTEREDKRRPPEPTSILVAGRPLTLSGEYEIGVDSMRRRVFDQSVRQRDRVLLQQGVELEAFYTFGAPLSAFAQLRLGMEQDLLRRMPNEISDRFFERGEMWLYSSNIAGSGLSLDAGRLHFEDDRRWWWDDDLDAVRLTYERPSFDIALALARELGPNRSDRSFIAPERESITRLLGEASWDIQPQHALTLFLLRQRDRSSPQRIGQRVSSEREDKSDAKLTWLGARLMGVFELPLGSLLGYWLDAARVRGTERVAEYETVSASRSVVEKLVEREVRGRAFDLGANLLLPLDWEPRLFAGYAFGSGDSAPEKRVDRSFRQSALHANESGFGGVRRFAHYGVLLQPELSNLKILTLGTGLSLLKSSSLDLMYHRYRLVEPGRSLRDSKLELNLTGERRDLGSELDLILALEEWQRIEFELSLAAFRAGRAFGAQAGTRSYSALVAMRIAF